METKHNIDWVLDDKQCRCNITLRRLHVTIVAVKDQSIIKYCECGCELAIYPDSRATIAGQQ
jgi:hypothetical protein